MNSDCFCTFMSLPWEYSLKMWPDEFGVTKASFNRFLECFLPRVGKEIALWQYLTDSGELCGFLIFDRQDRECLLVGNGFRLDGDGEGGRGYARLERILSVLNLLDQPYEFNRIHSPYFKLYPDNRVELKNTGLLAARIARDLSDALQCFQTEDDLLFFLPRQKISY